MVKVPELAAISSCAVSSTQSGAMSVPLPYNPNCSQTFQPERIPGWRQGPGNCCPAGHPGSWHPKLMSAGESSKQEFRGAQKNCLCPSSRCYCTTTNTARQGNPSVGAAKAGQKVVGVTLLHAPFHSALNHSWKSQAGKIAETGAQSATMLNSEMEGIPGALTRAVFCQPCRLSIGVNSCN